MSGRVRSVSSYQRQFLTQGWEMCATAAAAFEHPAALPASGLAWIAFQAPGTVASGLRAAGLWSLDSAARRFDAEDWWFRTRFAAPATSGDDRLVLGFDGLATVADVWLDGKPLLGSDNMFLAHEKSIDSRPDHELVIRFKALDRLLGARRPRPRWKAPMVENQQLRWFRTTLLGRTPGWSPAAAAVGPWRSIWVEKRAPIGIDRVSIDAHVRHGKGTVQVAIQFGPQPVALERVELVLCRADRKWSGVLSQADALYSGAVVIESPDLWWPHTHGEPATYGVALHVYTAAAAAPPIQIDLGATGFRTVTVDRTDDGFALYVNEVRIFCRGACWTPPDVVTLSGSPAAYRSALLQARDAGMNMLRLSGTMVYESEVFLDLCDALGILLWQDFMFANMDYPAEEPAFLDSVRREVQQQLDRLAGRPSLAVLCGNSEVEQQAAMWGAPRQLWSPALFHELLRESSARACPGVPYWPSSAHGGSFPHQPNSGTSSYYGVGAYLRPLEDARRSELRFATECLAFANVPDEYTISQMPGGLSLTVHHPQWKARAPRDLGAGWDFEDVRDFYLRSLFGVDPLQLRYSDHERYIELSRIVPGEAMAAAFAEWRRRKSSCHGALVWLLRDLWPGAGWGVVDSEGYPKAPWYYLRRTLQPVGVFIADEGVNGLCIVVVNDRARRLEGTLELTLYRDGETPIASGTLPVCAPPHQTVQIAAAEFFASFLDTSYSYRFGPLSHDLAVATLTDAAGDKLAEQFHFPAGLARPRRETLGLAAQLRRRPDESAELVVTTTRFAQSIAINAGGFCPEDNYFHLAPKGRRTIRLHPCPGKKAFVATVCAVNAFAAVGIDVLQCN